MSDKKSNCKISVGNITVEAPSVEDAERLFTIAQGVKQNNPINEAIR